jgi:thiazole synthase
MTALDDPLVIAGRTFCSRLDRRQGKHRHAVMADPPHGLRRCHDPVAVRRVNVTDRSQASLLDYIDTSRIFILPNTAGCYTAEEASARRIWRVKWAVQLDQARGDRRRTTLFPRQRRAARATRVLVGEGFVVLPYTNDDPIVCRKLEERARRRVMPLGAPIGSGLDPERSTTSASSANRRTCRSSSMPASARVGRRHRHGLGADGVLMNTAIALAGIRSRWPPR